MQNLTLFYFLILLCISVYVIINNWSFIVKNLFKNVFKKKKNNHMTYLLNVYWISCRTWTQHDFSVEEKNETITAHAHCLKPKDEFVLSCCSYRMPLKTRGLTAVSCEATNRETPANDPASLVWPTNERAWRWRSTQIFITFRGLWASRGCFAGKAASVRKKKQHLFSGSAAMAVS